MRNALLALSLFALPACAAPTEERAVSEYQAPQPPPAPSPFVEVERAELRSLGSWSQAEQDALRARRWDAAATLLLAEADAARTPVWAYVTAWSLVHADRAPEAEALLPLLAQAEALPPSWRRALEGEVLAAIRPVDALEPLGAVDAGSAFWARAQVQRAEVLLSLARTSEAWPIYEAVLGQEGCAPGVPAAALALGRHWGVEQPAGVAALRRAWTQCAGTEEDQEVVALLRGRPATWQEAGLRAEALMSTGDYDGAIALAESKRAAAEGDGEDACRLIFTLGRSHYKRNHLSATVSSLQGLGERCAQAAGGYGAKAMYLLGTAQFRKGQHREAAATYVKMAALYADDSYADDGLTRAGIALQEAGDLAGARALWQQGLERYPAGDTVPESTWRLAFSYYLDGQPEEALKIARSLGALPLDGDPVHVLAGRYWEARWTLYPQVADPTVAVADPAARAAAIAGWEALCREHPTSFYAILAFSRLQELAPEVASALDQPRIAPEPATTWTVSRSFWEDPHLQTGLSLMRVGLVQEGLAEWGRAAEAPQTGEEMAALIEARIDAGDWLFAHDAFRQWLKHGPPPSLGPKAHDILRVGYPDRYWPEVQAAAAPYSRYEPRLFHALVREESNFNKDIRSFAGAWGLSQLMPATAQQTAGWLGMKVTNADLVRPEVNLPIGAKYLDAMHKQLADSPYLALAAYNAGAGRQRQWLGAWGNVPTDEYVERIPFRETREYVKRVMGTWQLYRYAFDGGSAYPDLIRYNHQAQPE
ncbi:MAG: transglycosylase SLT domain-containing protein [Deltaproteobacteria bacterium]|nr:transglycosylase SLT domain-containing protein [Deltaproteobacteria bacterium]